MPSLEKSGTDGVQESGRNYASRDQDLEANRTLPTPTTPSFPGATYGFNPSDQPSHPPRRVKSNHSLKEKKSIASLHRGADTTDPTPPIPSLPQAIGDANAADDSGSYDEELAWGPSHPCFPHFNPHVPLSSPLYETTRIIRIRRDWMIAGDLAPTYSNIYPEILDPLLSEPEFRQVVNHINATLLEAFDPFSTLNWLDGFLGLITGWLWEDFRPSIGLKGKLRNLESWMENWNENVGIRNNVKLISLRRTGYMGLDVQIPDPQVKIVDDGDEDEHDNNISNANINNDVMSPARGVGNNNININVHGAPESQNGESPYNQNHSNSQVESLGLESGSMMANASSRQ